MKILLSIGAMLVLAFFTGFESPVAPEKKFDVCISTEELRLWHMIMDYRKEKGLPEIPLSKSLTYVAKTHCKDITENKADRESGCNGHSWSDKGIWSSCCYTPDHKSSACMWEKPGELTNFVGNGFEIACGDSYGGFVITAAVSLDLWKKSSGHNAVIINEGIWKDYKWKSIGIGIYETYSCVWFSDSEDTEGSPEKCGDDGM